MMNSLLSGCVKIYLLLFWSNRCTLSFMIYQLYNSLNVSYIFLSEVQCPRVPVKTRLARFHSNVYWLYKIYIYFPSVVLFLCCRHCISGVQYPRVPAMTRWARLILTWEEAQVHHHLDLEVADGIAQGKLLKIIFSY